MFSPAETSFYESVLEKGVSAHRALTEYHAAGPAGPDAASGAAAGVVPANAPPEAAAANTQAGAGQNQRPSQPLSPQQAQLDSARGALGGDEDDVIIVEESAGPARRPPRGGARPRRKKGPSLEQLHK